VPIAGGYVKILSRYSGKALDVLTGGESDGGNVGQWRYHGGPSQQWRIVSVSGW